MSTKVNEFAKNAMTSFGMSEKVAKEYMGQFGAMSKAFGNTEQMAYDQAAALTGLAGDVASFYNMSTDEAFTKLKAVYTGETEALKSLGVVMTQTALDEYALQQGLGKTTKQMSEQEKVALRLNFVTDRLSDASGDFVRTADGWANQTRVLSLRFDALKASIGQGLINVLTPIVRVLNAIIEKLQVAADAFKNFTAAIFGKSGSESGGIAGAAGSSGEIAENIGSAAGSAAKLKKSLMGFDKLNILPSQDSSGGSGGSGSSSSSPSSSSSVPVEDTTLDHIKEKLDKIKQQLIELGELTGVTELWNKFKRGVEKAKSALGTLKTALKNALEWAAPNIDGMGESLKNTFLTASNTVTTIWGDMWLDLTTSFDTWVTENEPKIELAFANIANIVTKYTTVISDAIGDIFEDFGVWWEEYGRPIYNAIIAAIQDVWGWVLDIWNSILSPVLTELGDDLDELWEKYLRPLWNNLIGLFTDVSAWVLTLWNKVLKPFVDWFITNFGGPIKTLLITLKNAAVNAVQIISGILSGLITTLRGILQFLTGVFTADWEKAWGGLKNIVKGVWDALKSGAVGAWNGIKNTFSGLAKFFKEIFTNAWTNVKNVFSTGGKIFDGIKDGIVSAFKTIVNAIIKGINKVVTLPFQGINSALSKIKKVNILGLKPFDFIKTINTPQIPLLANGGYVEANSPRLAIIGDNKREGEIVAPESKIAEAVAKGFAMVMSKMQQTQSNQRGTQTPLVIKIGETDFWQGFIDFHNSTVKRTGESPLLV
jgi:phage-related protein